MFEHGAGWVYSIRIKLLCPGEAGYQSSLQRGFDTCQLRSRHWVITSSQTSSRVNETKEINTELLDPDSSNSELRRERGSETVAEDNAVVRHVNGDGVIGRYPLLFEGGYRDDRSNPNGGVEIGSQKSGVFEYQSFSGRMGLEEAGGWLGGTLLFAPTSLAQPSGVDMEIAVEPFPLRYPKYMF